MKQIKLKKLEETIYMDKCENGLEIYVWVNKKVNTFKGTYVIKAGADDVIFTKNKKECTLPHGVAHYLEHIMCKNIDNTSLLGKFNELGSYSNAATYPDKTVYEFVGTENLKENLELLLDSIYQKKFIKEHIEGERGPILEESRMKKDNPSTLNYFEMNNSLFWKYPCRIIGLGTEEDIKKITEKDLETFYQTFYHPENSFVVVTGNVDPIEVIYTIKEKEKQKKYKKYLMPIRKKYKEPNKIVTNYKELYTNIEIPRVTLAIKVSMKNFKDIEEVLLLNIINLVLASNFGVTSLFKESILEKKLAVTLGSSAYIERDYLIIQIAAKTKYPEELLPILQEKIKNLELIEKDMKRKIKSEIANLVLSYEDPENVNDMLVYSLVRFGKIIENEKEILEKITMEEINNVFSKINLKEQIVLITKPRKKDEI